MNSLPARSFVVLKAKRDTLLLTAAAVAATFALAHAVRSRTPDNLPGAPVIAEAEHVWAGDLPPADQQSEPVPEKLTSNSLVVPKQARSKVALLAAGPVQVNRRECDGDACGRVQQPAKSVAISEPSRGTAAKKELQTASFVSRLNPMRYLPRSVRRSVDETGSAIGDWFRSF